MVFRCARSVVGVFSTLFIFFGIFLSPCAAESEITFVGNHFFSTGDLKKIAVQTPVDSLAARVSAAYRQEGFLTAQVNATSANGRITLEIAEGPRFRVSRVKLRGAEPLPQAHVQRLVSSVAGRPASQTTFDRFIKQILELGDNTGFPYTQVWLDSVVINHPPQADLQIRLLPGPQVVVREIRFPGLAAQEKKNLLRRLALREGDIFSQKSLERAAAELRQKRRVSVTGPPELYSGEQLADGIVVFPVKSRQTSSLDGALGYVPGAGSRKGNWVGGFDLLVDEFGGARTFGIRWARKSLKTSEVNLAYTEENPWAWPLDFTFHLAQQQRDTLYFQLAVSGALNWEVLTRLTLGLKSGWEKVVPGDRAPLVVFPSRKFSLGGEVTYDGTDDLFNPARGIRLSVASMVTRKRSFVLHGVAPEKPLLYQRSTTLDLTQYLPISRVTQVFFRLHGAGIGSSERVVPLADQFFLGGQGSVRGYQKDQFSGSRVAWTNLEYRLRFGEGDRVFLFTDAGYFYRREQSQSEIIFREATQVGFGLGLAVRRSFGEFEVSVGWPQHAAVGDGIVNFGVVNRF